MSIMLSTLRDLRSIRRIISKEVCNTLMSSLLFPRIDYCLSIFVSSSKLVICPLIRVIRTAGRILLQRRKYDRISQLLIDIGWRDIFQRILYRSLITTFRLVNAPISYLHLLLSDSVRPSSLRLRSSSTLLLHVRIHSSSFGRRSCFVAFPMCWNSLPQNSRTCTSYPTFKNKLHTILLSNGQECVRILWGS